ncbi:hypothetical protein NHQ30_011056 [Ciborinia camelliae]|nr:hypothetical protein NHQ30_011056 [Ciborinia camelliae]
MLFEQSSFVMDPSEGEPEYNVYADSGIIEEDLKERRRRSAFIPITSQPFVELKRSLLSKIQKEFPPSKIIGQKPEGWLRTWTTMPERPSKLFSFPTRDPYNNIIDDLEDIRMRLEIIGPARVNGFKLMRFKLLPGTAKHRLTLVNYYPFKDCLYDHNRLPVPVNPHKIGGQHEKFIE